MLFSNKFWMCAYSGDSGLLNDSGSIFAYLHLNWSRFSLLFHLHIPRLSSSQEQSKNRTLPSPAGCTFVRRTPFFLAYFAHFLKTSISVKVGSGCIGIVLSQMWRDSAKFKCQQMGRSLKPFF